MRKFRNIKCTSPEGLKFDSRGEYDCYKVLKILEHAGEIKDLGCQVKVYLTEAKILYKPDFKYFDVKIQKPVWMEYKGQETAVWRIKRRLWLHYGPGILKIVKDEFRLHEELISRTQT